MDRVSREGGWKHAENAERTLKHGEHNLLDDAAMDDYQCRILYG